MKKKQRQQLIIIFTIIVLIVIGGLFYFNKQMSYVADRSTDSFSMSYQTNGDIRITASGNCLFTYSCRGYTAVNGGCEGLIISDITEAKCLEIGGRIENRCGNPKACTAYTINFSNYEMASPLGNFDFGNFKNTNVISMCYDGGNNLEKISIDALIRPISNITIYSLINNTCIQQSILSSQYTNQYLDNTSCNLNVIIYPTPYYQLINNICSVINLYPNQSKIGFYQDFTSCNASITVIINNNTNTTLPVNETIITNNTIQNNTITNVTNSTSILCFKFKTLVENAMFGLSSENCINVTKNGTTCDTLYYQKNICEDAYLKQNPTINQLWDKYGLYFIIISTGFSVIVYLLWFIKLLSKKKKK